LNRISGSATPDRSISGLTSWGVVAVAAAVEITVDNGEPAPAEQLQVTDQVGAADLDGPVQGQVAGILRLHHQAGRWRWPISAASDGQQPLAAIPGGLGSDPDLVLATVVARTAAGRIEPVMVMVERATTKVAAILVYQRRVVNRTPLSILATVMPSRVPRTGSTRRRR
jgi:hypothetical protein